MFCVIKLSVFKLYFICVLMVRTPFFNRGEYVTGSFNIVYCNEYSLI